jgi:hypothetical protein
MSGFSAAWLELRAAADRRARAPALLAALRRRMATTISKGTLLRVVDLGAGTGSTLRLLSPLLPMPQHWTLVDSDAELLATLKRPPHASRWITVEPVQADLADRSLLAELGSVADLVTASALLDLVSESWCRTLVGAAARAHAVLYAALTYDGRIALEPPDPLDAMVETLFNRHQRRHKGFGPALGPDASRALARLAAAAGATLRTERSDWRLGPGDTSLLRPLLDGWATAALEMAPERGQQIAAWQTRRSALLDDRRLRVRVGHRDVLAWW